MLVLRGPPQTFPLLIALNIYETSFEFLMSSQISPAYTVIATARVSSRNPAPKASPTDKKAANADFTSCTRSVGESLAASEEMRQLRIPLMMVLEFLRTPSWFPRNGASQYISTYPVALR